MAEFATVGDSFIACMGIVTGNGDYYALEAAALPIQAQLFYWSIMLMITIVFFNSACVYRVFCECDQ